MGSSPTSRTWATSPENWLAVGGPGALLLHSAGTDHYPAVRVELWDGEPAPATTAWDQILTVTCDLSDQVRLQSVAATQSPRVLNITRPGPHHARVHAGRRAETAQLEQGSFAEGVEGWLIQLWPA